MANKFQVSTLILSRQHVTATGNLLYVNGLLVGSGIYQPTGDYALNSDLVASGLQLLGIIENSGQQNWLYTSGAYVDIFNTGSLLDGKINSLSGYSDLTFATVSNLQSTGSALDNKINSLSGFTNLLSGGLEVRLVQTGNSAVNHANGIGQNLSGNLTQTGANLILRDNDISGVLQTQINELYPRTNPSGYITGISTGEFVTRNETGQFASVTSLFNSGVTLTSTIINSGNAAITHANGIGSILSGKLTETGVLLGAQINSLSGFTLGASGALQAQIGSAGAQVRVTGSSSISIADFTGIGGLLIFTSGGQIFVSGGAASSTLNHGDGINLSGNLTQTGITLNNKIDSLSGFTLGLSGGLENRITQTGNGAVLHANGIGINLSGNLTQSGIQLGNKIDVLSGYSNTTFATIATVNLVSGNLIQTGIQLGGKIDSLSGFTLGVSGDLQLKINELYPRSNPSGYITGISTGNFVTRTETGQFYPASNPQQYVTSGNLFATGSTLDNKINSLSGFTINVSGGLETRLFQTGNSAVVHANGIGINLSGNLTNTGVTLLNTIVQSGNASVNHANGIGINLSGNLAQTGSTLDNKINTLSGFTLGASGALQAQIVGGAGTEVKITGSSTLATADFTGIGGLLVFHSGGQVFISGGSTSVSVPDNSTGSYVFRAAITSGVSEQFIPFPYELSANPRVLATIYNNFNASQIIPHQISGATTSGFWLVLSNAIPNSGYFVDVLGATSDTGYATTVVVQNYYTTGGTGGGAGDVTQAQLDSLSGYAEQIFVHRTGAEIISGAKIFVTGVIISGFLSQGDGNTVSNFSSFAQGRLNTILGSTSMTQGFGNVAAGAYNFAQGESNETYKTASSTRGGFNKASGDYSSADGILNITFGDWSHAEGESTIASGKGSHAEGLLNKALGVYSHAEGFHTTGIGIYSHSEGFHTLATGSGAHSEGFKTRALGSYSHAEGEESKAFGRGSHAEGESTIASGYVSHSEGRLSQSLASYSHAEGDNTLAMAIGSHSEGLGTVADKNYSHAQGKYNRTGVSGLFQVGRGTSNSNRLDAIYVSDIASNPSILSGYWNTESGFKVGNNFVLTGLVAGTNVTVNNNNNGTFTVNASAGGSNSDGINLSGNLTQTGISLLSTIQSTGSTLDNKINSLSGFASSPRGITAVIDGGGEVITTGIKMHLPIPFNCTVNNWTILGDVAGSIVVDVRNATYANFPTTTSIAGTEKPTLSSVQKNQDLSLTTWSTPITGGNVLSFVVESASTVNFVTVQLGITIT